MPVFLCCIVVFVVWLRYEISKSKKTSQKISDDFWTLEQQSNFVRKADISNLDYIIISNDDLPFVTTEDEELNKLQNQVKLFSQKKLLNLTANTNTELKLKYGTANLSLLSEYDQNFALFIQTLYKLANLLYKNGYIEEAQKALELGITHHSDIAGNYILLATIYKSQNDVERIGNLIKRAEELNTLMKDSILKSLANIMNSL